MSSVYSVDGSDQRGITCGPTVLTTNGGEHGTWSKAEERSLAILRQERGAGTSLAWSYLGGKLPGIRFRANGVLRFVQLLVSFAAIPLCFFACRFLGFDLLSQISFALAHLNTFSKGMALHGQFEKDDAPVFMFLRSLSASERIKVTQWYLPKSLWKQGILVPFAFLGPALYIIPVCLYIAQFSTFQAHQHAIILVFLVYPYCINIMEPMFLTMYFLSVGKALTKAIKEYQVFPGGVDVLKQASDAQLVRVNISAAYRNYEIMKTTIIGFSTSFQVFFFGAEFTLLVCVGIAAMGAYAEIIREDASLTKVFRCVGIVCFFVGGALIVVALARVSAGITGEAQKVLRKAHTVKGWVAANRPDMLIEANHFFNHVQSDCNTIGFTGFGITISPKLIAKSAYVCTSFVVTIGSLVLRQQGY
jgi:hypothetical protein|eukprot:Stramenopile-MAST_4_protein_1807